jgi:hypothetical protein
VLVAWLAGCLVVQLFGNRLLFRDFETYGMISFNVCVLFNHCYGNSVQGFCALNRIIFVTT